MWDEMYRISTAQTNPNCRSTKEVFLVIYLFSKLDLNTANMKNLRIPGYMKA